MRLRGRERGLDGNKRAPARAPRAPRSHLQLAARAAVLWVEDSARHLARLAQHTAVKRREPAGRRAAACRVQCVPGGASGCGGEEGSRRA